MSMAFRLEAPGNNVSLVRCATVNVPLKQRMIFRFLKYSYFRNVYLYLQKSYKRLKETLVGC